MTWGTKEEIERRNRIRVALYAYAYEFQNDSLVSDSEFDDLCKLINPDMPTGHDLLDEFFRKEFVPDTGMWIHNHPDLEGLERLYVAKKTGKWFNYTMFKIYKDKESC